MYSTQRTAASRAVAAGERWAGTKSPAGRQGGAVTGGPGSIVVIARSVYAVLSNPGDSQATGPKPACCLENTCTAAISSASGGGQPSTRAAAVRPRPTDQEARRRRSSVSIAPGLRSIRKGQARLVDGGEQQVRHHLGQQRVGHQASDRRQQAADVVQVSIRSLARGPVGTGDQRQQGPASLLSFLVESDEERAVRVTAGKACRIVTMPSGSTCSDPSPSRSAGKRPAG